MERAGIEPSETGALVERQELPNMHEVVLEEERAMIFLSQIMVQLDVVLGNVLGSVLYKAEMMLNELYGRLLVLGLDVLEMEFREYCRPVPALILVEFVAA